MDADVPNTARAPSAKVIPFPRKEDVAAPSSELDSATSSAAELVRQAMVEAVIASEWGNTRQEDHEVLEDERAFRRRFGFTVNREQRRKTLQLKHDSDLTDPEIRRLRWSGSLDLISEPARVRASHFIQGYGYVMIAVLCLLMLFGMLAVARTDTYTAVNLMAVTAFEALLVCMLSLAYYGYIEPSRIDRRIRRSGQ